MGAGMAQEGRRMAPLARPRREEGQVTGHVGRSPGAMGSQRLLQALGSIWRNCVGPNSACCELLHEVPGQACRESRA